MEVTTRNSPESSKGHETAVARNDCKGGRQGHLSRNNGLSATHSARRDHALAIHSRAPRKARSKAVGRAPSEFPK
jgi:hypothetical protein